MKQWILMLFLVLCVGALCEDAVPGNDAVVVRIFVTSIEEVYREYYTVMQNTNFYVIKRLGNKYFYTYYYLQYNPVQTDEPIASIHDPLAPCQKKVIARNINESTKVVENTDLRVVDGVFIRADTDIIREKIISFYMKESSAIKQAKQEWEYIKLFTAVPLTNE